MLLAVSVFLLWTCRHVILICSHIHLIAYVYELLLGVILLVVYVYELLSYSFHIHLLY